MSLTRASFKWWLLSLIIYTGAILTGIMFIMFVYSDSKIYQTSPLQLSTFRTTSYVSPILNSIISPPNQIPKPLSQNSLQSISLQETRRKYYADFLRDFDDHDNVTFVDEKHLGGFLPNDTKSYERDLWQYIIPKFDITSVIDIGCGMGVSTLFFASKMAPYVKWNDVLCIEGSHDAIQHSHVKNITVQHDYSLGPFWPQKMYDMAWSIEFLEHVNETFMPHYMATFKKAKLILMTASPDTGWSHLNIQPREYWIDKFESYGFIYDAALTKICRDKCTKPDKHCKTWKCKTSYFGDNGFVFWNSYFYENITQENIKRFQHLTLFEKLILYKSNTLYTKDMV